MAKRIAKRHGNDTLSYEDQKEVVQFRAARVIVGWDGIKVPFSEHVAFRLEARGDGRPLKMANTMNAGPDVLAFARYAARHSGFPLDVPREVLLAAGELRSSPLR